MSHLAWAVEQFGYDSESLFSGRGSVSCEVGTEIFNHADGGKTPWVVAC